MNSPLVNQNQLAHLEEVMTADQIQLSEKLGAIKATSFIKKLVTVTEIKLLAEIKESKQYKGLKVIDGLGKVVTVTTWDMFCQNLGMSCEKVDQDILNLSTFGEDFLETSQRMGLGYRDLRKLRKLPEESRELIINGESVKTEDRESLIELLEEMTVKHAKAIEVYKAEAAAKDELNKRKTEKINALDDELNLAKHRQAQAANVTASPDTNEDEAKAISMMTTAVIEILQSATTFNRVMNEALTLCGSPLVQEQYESNLRLTYQSLAQRLNDQGIQIDFKEMVAPAWLATALDQMAVQTNVAE